MNKDIQAAAAETFPRILEGAAFLFSDPMPEGETPELDGWEPEGVSMVWQGPNSGSIHLWASLAFRKVLAANMLGLEEDDPDVDARSMDALKELLNMVAGNSLTEAFGTAPVFHLGIPQQLQSARLESDQAEGTWFLVEEHPILLLAKLSP